jgi:hypothetical protein
MKIALFFCLFYGSVLLAEKVDSKCATECRNKGYQYHYCEMKCLSGKSSLEKEREASHAPLESEIDPKCMNTCIQDKKPYNTCEVKCRY